MNQQAYDDVLDDLPPRFPDSEEYMSKYRFWTEIANRPENRIEDQL